MTQYLAVTAPTQFVESRGRTLAYRTFGDGRPLILALRFRGVMDSWDPAFLEALASDFRVYIFDYSGFGQSTGTPTYDIRALGEDVIDLADALGLDRFDLAGWSLGGQAAQAAAADHPNRIDHLILIGTAPPGPLEPGIQPIFYEHAFKPDYDLQDEVVLFFEPKSQASIAAAAASHERMKLRQADPSPQIAVETFKAALAAKRIEEIFVNDGERYRAALIASGIPILAISGDSEIAFPVENWFRQVGAWPNLHLLIVPQAGHGPQHQHPEMCADFIKDFIRSTVGA